MSPLLLPKKKKEKKKKKKKKEERESSTPFHIPVMCELCKQKTKILLASNCQRLCKLSVQNICTFSTWNLYQTLSLGVQINFHKRKKKAMS